MGGLWVVVKAILTTPTPHISNKYDPKICHRMRGHVAQKSLEIKELAQRMRCRSRLLWHTNSDFYGIRTPTFMPHEVFFCRGVGVVFNMLSGGGGGLQYVEFVPLGVLPQPLCEIFRATLSHFRSISPWVFDHLRQGFATIFSNSHLINAEAAKLVNLKQF